MIVFESEIRQLNSFIFRLLVAGCARSLVKGFFNNYAGS